MSQHSAAMLDLVLAEVEDGKPYLERRARILVGAQIFHSIVKIQEIKNEANSRP